MLTLTDKAVDVLKTVIEGQAVRIGVDAGSCSGLQYHMALEDGPTGDDEVLEFGGIRVLVAPASSMWLTGVVVDYVEGENGAGFWFDNPNARAKCSCSGGCG